MVSPLLQYIASTYNQVSTYRCDYSEGQWVSAPGHARRAVHGTECNVKDSENCVINGRPDTGYLDWRWQPSAASCQLPGFDAAKFLAAIRGKHVAFVGDSMARNHAESLVCLLSASFPYSIVIVYRDPEPWIRKFWRWEFPSDNVTVSVEKAWDDPTMCARRLPYRDGEREVDTMHAELRSIVREEVRAAMNDKGTRVELLDVTKLATMRPDGHPSVYMNRDPFALGVPERLLSDCLHFCLPGQVDTLQ